MEYFFPFQNVLWTLQRTQTELGKQMELGETKVGVSIDSKAHI